MSLVPGLQHLICPLFNIIIFYSLVGVLNMSMIMAWSGAPRKEAVLLIHSVKVEETIQDHVRSALCKRHIHTQYLQKPMAMPYNG